MSAILNQMAALFLIMAIGYVANKLKVLTIEPSKMLSKIVMKITLPCLILSSVMGNDITLTNSEVGVFVLASLSVYALGFFLSIFVPFLLHVPKTDSGLYRFMTVFANVGFMGFPIVYSIFGPSAAFYVALFNIPFSFLVFSVGIILVAGKGEKIDPRLFINPTFIAAAISVLIFTLKISMPAVIVNTTELVGQITTPAAMLIIGSTLATIPIKEIFNEWRLYPFTVIKLILIPVLTCFMLNMFISNALMLGVLVVLSAMPVATNTTMICMEYGGNEQLASKSVFITTVLSMVTIPMIVYFFLF